MAAVVADLQANAAFLKDVGTHGKTFGLEEIRNLSLTAPAARIALIGSRGGGSALPRGGAAPMGRANNGQFRGPLQMIAFLVEQDMLREEARDRVIILADQFMTFIEHRTFGLLSSQAGPALVTGFEVLYSAALDAQGAAIAAVSWEQEVVFGRDLHAEDDAFLEGLAEHTEAEWAAGNLQPDVPPLAQGQVSTVYTGESSEDTEEPEPV
jgi:hypothetical protein